MLITYTHTWRQGCHEEDSLKFPLVLSIDLMPFPTDKSVPLELTVFLMRMQVVRGATTLCVTLVICYLSP